MSNGSPVGPSTTKSKIFSAALPLVPTISLRDALPMMSIVERKQLDCASAGCRQEMLCFVRRCKKGVLPLHKPSLWLGLGYLSLVTRTALELLMHSPHLEEEAVISTRLSLTLARFVGNCSEDVGQLHSSCRVRSPRTSSVH